MARFPPPSGAQLRGEWAGPPSAVLPYLLDANWLQSEVPFLRKIFAQPASREHPPLVPPVEIGHTLQASGGLLCCSAGGPW